MIWVDREVKKIKERNLLVEWVDDMKTPSGRVHVGALRGIVIHDLVYKVLKENAVKTTFTWIFDDHDPMDSIPAYLDYEKWEQYAGIQLYKIPSPEPGYKSFADYYAQEFIKVFESINCHPEILWGSKLYNSGKMNDVIREVLDAAPKIREIYSRIAKAIKPDDWFPFHPVCTLCQKIGTTQVYKWDGTNVYYRCVPFMVAWAKGCGNEGKVSPYNGNGKMPWKVEWPAKWKALGITVEGAGKDHMSKGGSHDIATAICNEVLHYPVPYPLPYEHFTSGGRKMSSSKGIGATAKEMSQILPPDLLRFLIVRTPINSAIDFNSFGDTILNLFDDYDRCMNAYFHTLENKVPKGKQGEVTLEFARIIELSEVAPLPKKRIFLPRFRTIVNLLKTKADSISFFKNQKGSVLNHQEKILLDERIRYAKQYFQKYAGEKETIQLIDHIPLDFALSDTQKLFIRALTEDLSRVQPTSREHIQQIIFETLKKNDLKPKEVFQALYQVLIGRYFGPKVSDLILEFGMEKVLRRLKEIT